MNRLLIIGGASSDMLHLENRTVACPGGAGMYTAMAAARCGARVTLFAPRPNPCPELLQPVAARLEGWLGPLVLPEELPRFEIAYRQGKTEYLHASFGAVEALAPEMLPADLSEFDLVHVTPLGDVQRQLSFVRACRQRRAALISAGANLLFIDRQMATVRAVMEEADFFFMNGQEAKAIFGAVESAWAKPGKVLYVTLGAQGACILQGSEPSQIPAVRTVELDPTGAGDAFCGAVLAYLLQNEHPVMAARHAAPLVADSVTRVGPEALLSPAPPPEAPLDERVQINNVQVQKTAGLIAAHPEALPYAFTGPELPPAGHPQALEYFFAATLQQFSFWFERDGCYERPMLARLRGASKKGSDYLWDAFRRQLERDEAFCSPARQATLGLGELLEIMRSDDGDDPLPAPELHLEKANLYGRDMLALGLTPQGMVAQASTSDRPLRTLMSLLDQVGGYKEDPLRKKSSLLALILSQRPEGFLPLGGDEPVAPVMDYHAMRACLRIGLVDVLDAGLETKLQNRQVVSGDEEWAVRFACYLAYERLVSFSGKRYGAVGWFLFTAMRKHCLEMSAPDCPACHLNAICAQRKPLFQPIYRTSFY